MVRIMKKVRKVKEQNEQKNENSNKLEKAKELEEPTGEIARKWLFRGLCIFVFLIASISAFGITYAVSDKSGKFIKQLKAEARQITSEAGLTLSEVFVKGRNRTEKQELLKAMRVKRNMPMIALDLEDARKKIEKLPWVESASIERRLPNLIHVNIVEKTPIALWQKDGKYFPVDTKGNIVNASIVGLEHLPVVVGKDAPEHTPELMKVLAEQPSLQKRTKAAIRVGNRRWDVVIDDVNKGISISLPEENPEEALAKLARLEENNGILKRKLTLIDLRLQDKLTVRLDDGKGKTLYNRKHNIKVRSGIPLKGIDA